MVTSTRRRTHPPPRNRFVSTRSRADPAIRARVPSKAAARNAATSTRYTQTDRTANPISAPTGLVVPQRPSVPEPVMLARMAATCRGTVQLAASSGGGATTMNVRTVSADSRRTIARTIMTPSPAPEVAPVPRSDRLGERGAGHANLHAASPQACGIDEPPLAVTWPSLAGLARSIPSDDASTWEDGRPTPGLLRRLCQSGRPGCYTEIALLCPIGLIYVARGCRRTPGSGS